MNKSNHYRNGLEGLKQFDYFTVQGTVGKLSSKFTPSDRGGYYTKTLLLLNVLVLMKRKSNGSISVVRKIDHVWLSADNSSIVRDKNVETNDIVEFKASVIEYYYSTGEYQLGIQQCKRGHKNFTKKYSIGFDK